MPDQNSFFQPGPIKGRRSGIAVILGVVLRGLLVKDQADYVLGVSPVESILSFRRNDIIRGSDHPIEVASFLGIIADTTERNDQSHLHSSPFSQIRQTFIAKCGDPYKLLSSPILKQRSRLQRSVPKRYLALLSRTLPRVEGPKKPSMERAIPANFPCSSRSSVMHGMPISIAKAMNCAS